MIGIALKTEWEKHNIFLSEREFEIIKQMANGNASKEIAAALDISIKTVEVHRHNILKKTKFKNSVQLCVELYRKGLLK